MKRIFRLSAIILMSSMLFTCNEKSSPESNSSHPVVNNRPLADNTLRGVSPHTPIGAVIYGKDDFRFQQPFMLNTYADELAFFEREIDYVGHDNAFRMQRIYNSPTDSDFSRADEFVEWKIAKNFRFPVLAGSYSLNHSKFKKVAREGYHIVVSELTIAINTSWPGIWPRQTKAQHKVQRMAFNNFVK